MQPCLKAIESRKEELTTFLAFLVDTAIKEGASDAKVIPCKELSLKKLDKRNMEELSAEKSIYWPEPLYGNDSLKDALLLYQWAIVFRVDITSNQNKCGVDLSSDEYSHQLDAALQAKVIAAAQREAQLEGNLDFTRRRNFGLGRWDVKSGPDGAEIVFSDSSVKGSWLYFGRPVLKNYTVRAQYRLSAVARGASPAIGLVAYAGDNTCWRAGQEGQLEADERWHNVLVRVRVERERTLIVSTKEWVEGIPEPEPWAPSVQATLADPATGVGLETRGARGAWRNFTLSLDEEEPMHGPG